MTYVKNCVASGGGFVRRIASAAQHSCTQIFALLACMVLGAAEMQAQGVSPAVLAQGRKGLASYSRGDYGAAIREYDQAIAALVEMSSVSDEVKLLLARLYYDRAFAYAEITSLEKAMADLDQAVALRPDFADAFIKRGNLRVTKVEWEVEFEELAQVLGFSPEVTFSRKQALQGKSEFKAAWQDYDRAIKLNPQSALAYNNRALLKHELQDYEAALADFDAALAVDETLAAVWHNRGVACQAKGDFKQAIRDYSKAIERNGWAARSYLNRSLMWQELQQPERARADEEQAQRLPLDDRYSPRLESSIARLN